MLTTKLVHAVERHRESIAAAAVRRMRGDPTTPTIGALPDSSLFAWGKELAGSFRLWSEAKEHDALAQRYFEFGQERYREHIPIAELIRACHIWRESSVGYLRDQGFQSTSLDIYLEEEVEHELAAFFDFTAYHMARGYENARTQRISSESARDSDRIVRSRGK